MKPGEWVAIISTVATIVVGGIAGWVHLETRMTGFEKEMEQQVEAERILRDEMLELIKKTNALEGMHSPHHKTPHMPKDDEVMAETYPIGSEM